MQNSFLKNATISVIAFAVLTGFIMLSFKWSNDIAFTQFLIIYFLQKLFLFVGLGFILVRILRGFIAAKWFYNFACKLTDANKFRYVLLAVGNTFMGVISIVFYLLIARADIIMIKMMLPNLIIGLILLMTTFLSKNKSRVSEVLQD